MEQVIVSDTNVWLDYEAIHCPTLPLGLSCQIVMWEEAIERELGELGYALIRAGLVSTEITTEEFYLAESYETKYRNPSRFDRVALAIAKNRGLRLVTGDKALRLAAEVEGVITSGTIWILDRLLMEGMLSDRQYRKCAGNFLDACDRRRLPVDELRVRLEGGGPVLGGES